MVPLISVNWVFVYPGSWGSPLQAPSQSAPDAVDAVASAQSSRAPNNTGSASREWLIYGFKTSSDFFNTWFKRPGRYSEKLHVSVMWTIMIPHCQLVALGQDWNLRVRSPKTWSILDEIGENPFDQKRTTMDVANHPMLVCCEMTSIVFFQYRSDPLHGVWPARSLWNIIVYIYIHTICTHASYRPGWCFYHQTSLKSLGVINLLVCIGGAISKIAHQFSARFQIECLVRWINFLFIFG